MPSEYTKHELIIVSHSLGSSWVLGMEKVNWVLRVSTIICRQCTGHELSQGVLQQLGCAGWGFHQAWLVHLVALEIRMALCHLDVGCIPFPWPALSGTFSAFFPLGTAAGCQGVVGCGCSQPDLGARHNHGKKVPI